MQGVARDRPADWLTVHQALERILDGVRPSEVETVALREAAGRVLAEGVVAPVDQPPWDNSAMDGYAVRAADVLGASPERPVKLEVVEAVAAGDFPTRPLGTGQATKVMTGAPVPTGADSVIRVEHTTAWQAPADGRDGGDALPAEPGTVVVINAADAGHNVRRRGEDVRTGDQLLAAGRVVGAPEAGALAMAGCTRVRVYRRPVVAILSNGDELVEPEDFAEVRAGRKIVNSNAYALAAAVRSLGALPKLLGIAGDDEASLRERLRAGSNADALVTTAGASVGDRDLMKDVLAELGFQLGFWRVRMQPGSPFSFGHLGGKPVFGLPGNPVSALVTFEVLVRPALRRMSGRSEVHNPTLRVRLAEPISPGPPGRIRYLRVRLDRGGPAGEPLARLTGPQGSGILTSLVAADALLVLPARDTPIAAGERVTAMLLRESDPGQEEVGY